MAFISIPNCAQVELIFEVFGQRCENVYHVYQPTGWDSTNLADVAGAFIDWYTVDGKTLTHDECGLSLIVAKDMESSTGAAIEVTGTLPIYGTRTTSDPLPLNVTAAVSFGTALRGRSYRGRIYQVGLTADAVVDNQLHSGYRSAMIDAYANLIAAVHTAGFDLCVASKFSGGSPRSAGITTVITSVNVDINVDSQRRRLTGRGQ